MKYKAITLLSAAAVLGILASSCKFKKQPDSQEAVVADSSLHNAAREIAAATFVQLADALGNSMAFGGVQGAVDLCRLQALPLTDSVAINYGVKVQRIAVRYRNPVNAADESEAQIFADWEKQLEAGNDPSAILLKEGDSRIWYGAIRIGNPLCLSCHGKPGRDIKTEDYQFIRESYPQDKATNFRLGDIRGAWKISFPVDYKIDS